LDRYEQTDTDRAIQEAASLQELLDHYDQAKQRFEELEAERKALEENLSKDDRDVVREKFREDHKAEYEREDDLRDAISTWEEKSNEIRELRVFWTFGFVLFGVGLFLQRRGQDWLGMALIIPGIVEMIWWTSPSFRFIGSPKEFDRLLDNKLLFTFITILLLVAAWVARERRRPANRT
jgi:hypothetical protein